MLLWSGRAELLLIILAVFLLFILPACMWYLARVKGERWWRRYWPFRRRRSPVTAVDARNGPSSKRPES
ncbi:MAG: hypothetical protein AAF488_11630 [Planctomycetota bacterium]